MTKYTVAVAGATGYAGGEALRILAAHPAFEVTAVAGHSLWRTLRQPCSTAMT